MIEETDKRDTGSIEKKRRRTGVSGAAIAAIAVVVAAAVIASAWYVATRGNAGSPEIVHIDGSSTVYPISSAWAIGFNNPQRQVVVKFSGTGGGFQKFCRGETDLSDASRPIKQSERDLCAQNGITGRFG